MSIITEEYRITNNYKPVIQVRLDSPKAMPLRAHPSDAGADLFSSHDSFLLYPGDQRLVDTGVSFKIPEGFVGYVFNRSSQGKIAIQIPHSVGVIDSLYRGNVKVLLRNNGEDPYEISQYATRIAQIVISPVVLATWNVTSESKESWENTSRGIGGFGSSN